MDFPYEASHGSVLEVRTLVDRPQSGPHRQLGRGKDFDCSYLAVEGSTVLLGAQAKTAHDAIVEQRRARYEVPIGVGDHQWRAVYFVEGILLIGNMRVPGVSIRTIQNSTRGSDIPTLMNSLLRQLGFRLGVHEVSLVQEYARRRPGLVFVANDLRASTLVEACGVFERTVSNLVALLSLQRDSSGIQVSAFVEGIDVDEATVWIDTPIYQGNLIGGFISGESQHDIVRRSEALQGDPRLQLWLSLNRDALAESRWDFRFFRLFNLLEVIGRELYGDDTAVVDFQLNRVMQNGQPVTTRSARAKIYKLVQALSSVVRSAEQNFCVRPHQSFWNEAGVWVGIRDAVAHDGGLRPDSGTRIRSARKVAAAMAVVAAASAGQPESTYLMEIRQTVKLLLGAMLDGRFPP